VVQAGREVKKVVDYRTFSEAHGENFFNNSPVVEIGESGSPGASRIILLELRKFKSKYKETHTARPNPANFQTSEPTFNKGQNIKKKGLASYAHGLTQTGNVRNEAGSQQQTQDLTNYQPNQHRITSMLLASEQHNNPSYRILEQKMSRQQNNFLESGFWESEQNRNSLLS